MPTKKNKFLVISLEENKAKKLAQVIGNETSKKIIDFLQEKSATETEIAKALKIPASTVNYNVKLLVDGGLVKSEEFHYSAKGKEVNHYSLANQFILIAPKAASFPSQLKRFVPVAAIIAGTGFIINFLTKTNIVSQQTSGLAQDAARETAEAAASPVAEKLAASTAIAEPNVAIWFVAGGFAALVLVIAISFIVQQLRR